MNEEEQEEDLQSPPGALTNERQISESLPTPKSSIDVQSLIENDTHDVTFTVTVAIAVSSESDEQSQLKDAVSKQMVDAPRAQNYYHLEYNLLPEDELIKTDVVTYGVACKVYMEKHEAKVVKTWQTGDVTWFAWAHSQTVTLTKKLLLKLFDHTVELRLWNTKDKCSTRARFDRPKAFRLPQPKLGEKPEDIGGVKAMITKLLKNYESMQPKKGTLIRPLLLHGSSASLDGKNNALESTPDQTTTNVKLLVSAKDVKIGRPMSHVSVSERSSTGAALKSKKSKIDRVKIGGKEDRELRNEISNYARVQTEKVKKFGIFSIPVRLALLFGGKRTVLSRLEIPVPGIEDAFLDVSINCPLLSVIMQEDLNPMMIQICNATSLPASPMSYDDLKLKCQPVYCKYTFFKEPEHITRGKEHGKNVYWDDTNIVLLGTMESSQLKEFLNGPGMEIELHDRDRKPDQVKLKPALFGDDLEDEKISNVGTVESRRTLYNPFHGRDQPWDPYGVAKVDLSELLLGCCFLELKIPVLNCPIPDILGTVPNSTGKLIGIAGAVDGPVDQPFSAGHYVQNSTMLKLKIQLAYPLTIPSQQIAKGYIAPSIECPFNRIIFMFDYHNLELLRNLQTLVMSFNAKALALDTMPQHIIDTALSTYKLSIVQQCNLNLDIITGFHIMDGVRHIFVLEGLGYRAISILWETLPQPKESDVCILYNSALRFSKRLYGSMDVDLCRVKLHEPLSVIVQQPLLYIRDMVFRPCYDALIKLDQITKMNKMRHVVKNDLFPTAEMVVTLSREFGIPFTQKDFEELQPLTYEETIKQDFPIAEPVICKTGHKAGIPLDTYNYTYEEHLRKEQEPKNYISINIDDVHTKSDEIHAQRARSKKTHITVDADPVYNYSTQVLNSTELAKDCLRQHLREQDPREMYTYNQEFMSALFSLVNIEQERKDSEAASRARWRTDKGWTSSEKKSTMQSYAHPHCPDSARLDDLKEEWLENFLHTNIIKSPVDRDHYPWCDRGKDFDLYTRPARDFGNSLPSAGCISGGERSEDQKAAKLKLYHDWQSRVVTDIRQYFHRVLPATEMKMRGIHSSNQLDRLKGLLKDPVRKCGLSHGSNVNDIPALAVINDPLTNRSGTSTQQAEHQLPSQEFCGLRPGDFSHSWMSDDNHIPCNNYEHEKFKNLKNYDFSAYHKSRSKLSLRPILALRPEERDNILFRLSFSASPYSRPLPPVTPKSQNSKILQNLTHHDKISDEPQNFAFETVKDGEASKLLEMIETENEERSLPTPARMDPSQQTTPVIA